MFNLFYRGWKNKILQGMFVSYPLYIKGYHREIAFRKDNLAGFYDPIFIGALFIGGNMSGFYTQDK